ncbi:DUF4097 family beta strand repeat-containing protein [Agromyces mangrovi Wang et al. 2018]|uniref:DUF4097 family beta strand repeat-containing protein n=1 Tax=Agromyces mangrovi TaxID=1858653 RepID=UPI002573563F|nr:DUF4097 family beta strand repeat-containing protein [Agromyces mangrovi]BDZ65511.1 lipoprotein [Agromyces mangrovi]
MDRLGPPQSFSDDATVTERVTAIEIDEPAGSVAIEATRSATDITLERTVRYWGIDRDVDETHEVTGGTLVLHGCGRNCTVSYVLEVPEGLDVSGRTSNGAIELTGVADVDVATSNGRIELDDVTGTVEVETSNGRIIGNDLTGDGVDASTSNGPIEIELGTPQDVTARTSNGPIELRVPGGPYAVETDTSNGRVDVDIATDPNGEFTLDLRTSNGSIDVTES